TWRGPTALPRSSSTRSASPSPRCRLPAWRVAPPTAAPSTVGQGRRRMWQTPSRIHSSPVRHPAATPLIRAADPDPVGPAVSFGAVLTMEATMADETQRKTASADPDVQMDLKLEPDPMLRLSEGRASPLQIALVGGAILVVMGVVVWAM